MNSNVLNRVFIARLAGTAVFDPNGDPVGKVRDAVATLRSNSQPARILGLVVEVPLRRRVFVPITRVTSIESGAVVITGLVNMRRFESRTGELLVLGDLIDRSITLLENGEPAMLEFDIHFSKIGQGDVNEEDDKMITPEIFCYYERSYIHSSHIYQTPIAHLLLFYFQQTF
jgi:hypothetical protein